MQETSHTSCSSARSRFRWPHALSRCSLRNVFVAVVTTVALCVVGVASYVRWKAVRLFLAYSIVLPILGATAFVHGIPLTTDSAEAADVEIPRQVPIVLVVFDEFPVSSLLTRAGEIDAVRYPNFGELARVANWYPNATTVHDHTTSAVPAILTGQLPRQGDLPLLADHPDNVFTLLGASYRFRVHELVTHLCSTQLCQRDGASVTERLPSLFSDVGVVYLHGLLPDAIAEHLPSIDQSWGRFLQQGDPGGREPEAVTRHLPSGLDLSRGRASTSSFLRA